MKNVSIYLLYIISIVFTTTVYSQSDLISEDILIKNDSIKLPGTLTYNKALKEQPLVIYIHGSGNSDRNGNQPGTYANPNYIKQLSDSLTARGIAFYRYDKRSSLKENMKHTGELSLDLFVDDANSVINNFTNDKRFSSINLIGHSQGSLIGMLCAKTRISKYISLAGPGESIDKTLVRQYRALYGDAIASTMESHFKELLETGSVKNIDPFLLNIFNETARPFFKSWATYNPIEEIKKLEIPILILNGDKDLNVKVEDANNLHAANPNSELVIIKNMSHALKTIEKDEDNVKSHFSPDFPLSEQLVVTLEAFIKK